MTRAHLQNAGNKLSFLRRVRNWADYDLARTDLVRVDVARPGDAPRPELILLYDFVPKAGSSAPPIALARAPGRAVR